MLEKVAMGMINRHPHIVSRDGLTTYFTFQDGSYITQETSISVYESVLGLEYDYEIEYTFTSATVDIASMNVV